MHRCINYHGRWMLVKPKESEMTESKNLWGGRFKEKADPAFAAFNSSFSFDRRLFAADITASIAYARALVGAGALTIDESTSIKSALEQVLTAGRASSDYFNDSTAEDVHSFVEARLIELIGDLGRKLHTGRSRNDQVATDFRLWLREALDDLSGL